MTATTYTITATNYGGAITYVRHDLTLDAARLQVAQLDADGWDDVDVTPPLPETVAEAIARQAHDKAVCCAVVGVCVIAFIAATILGFII